MDIDKPCYKNSSGIPCYKYGGDSPIYKINPGGITEVSFAWGSSGKDLDICAYWEGDSSLKVGYDYNTNTSEQVSGPYHIQYSGDITDVDASEWCKIYMSPWGGNVSRTFRIHFNFYEYSSSYPASTCTVIASQQDGQTKVKRDQHCGINYHQPASASDMTNSCVISFDETGRLISIS